MRLVHTHVLVLTYIIRCLIFCYPLDQLFVAQCSYPKWTPVTVVIQDGEVWEFYSHFSSSPFVDLRLAERSSALYLPPQKEPDFPAPANSQTKVTRGVSGSIT